MIFSIRLSLICTPTCLIESLFLQVLPSIIISISHHVFEVNIGFHSHTALGILTLYNLESPEPAAIAPDGVINDDIGHIEELWLDLK